MIGRGKAGSERRPLRKPAHGRRLYVAAAGRRGKAPVPRQSSIRSSSPGDQPLRAGRAAASALPSEAETNDLAALAAVLRQRRQALEQTVRSSQEYWKGVHRILEVRVALEETENRFRALYDFIPVPFLVLDPTLRIVSANAAASALCGQATAAAGRHLAALLDPGSYRELVAVLRAGGPPSPLEAQLRTERGSIPVQITTQIVDYQLQGARETRGRRTYYLAIVDLSEVRRLEQEREALAAERQESLEAARAAREANQAKDEFIAMLSHELRTPLTPILAAVDLLRNEPLPLATREAIGMIRRNAVWEARLIDDLLDVARIRQRRLVVERRLISLHALLAEVVDDWRPEAARRGLEVELELGAHAALVEADADRVAQVLRNVLGNATKFSDPGGRVRIGTANANGRIRVTITDTGVGMGPDELERLYQTFAGARPQRQGRAGLGLGLAISRGILDAHGGRIEVTSGGLGRGTSVTIELSASEADAVEPEADAAGSALRAEHGRPSVAGAAAVSRDRARGRHVLLIEDHADSAETLAMALEMSGYRVEVAGSLTEARAVVDGCDLIISDISLPDGTGLDLVREIRSRRSITAIALSGYGTEDDVRRSLEAGFSEHLVKPVAIERLLASLERVAGS